MGGEPPQSTGKEIPLRQPQAMSPGEEVRFLLFETGGGGSRGRQIPSGWETSGGQGAREEPRDTLFEERKVSGRRSGYPRGKPRKKESRASPKEQTTEGRTFVERVSNNLLLKAKGEKGGNFPPLNEGGEKRKKGAMCGTSNHTARSTRNKRATRLTDCVLLERFQTPEGKRGTPAANGGGITARQKNVSRTDREWRVKKKKSRWSRGAGRGFLNNSKGSPTRRGRLSILGRKGGGEGVRGLWNRAPNL